MFTEVFCRVGTAQEPPIQPTLRKACTSNTAPSTHSKGVGEAIPCTIAATPIPNRSRRIWNTSNSSGRMMKTNRSRSSIDQPDGIETMSSQRLNPMTSRTIDRIGMMANANNRCATATQELTRQASQNASQSSSRIWKTRIATGAAIAVPVALAVPEAALAHALRDKVEAAYQRGDLLERRRRLMEEWAAFCDRPALPAGEVVTLAAVRAFGTSYGLGGVDHVSVPKRAQPSTLVRSALVIGTVTTVFGSKSVMIVSATPLTVRRTSATTIDARVAVVFTHIDVSTVSSRNPERR